MTGFKNLYEEAIRRKIDSSWCTGCTGQPVGIHGISLSSKQIKPNRMFGVRIISPCHRDTLAHLDDDFITYAMGKDLFVEDLQVLRC
ncbi:MAG: hypothetical protein JSC085_000321 [Candidatus Tokpelaia sp. JSC085]|nr:MAG: hypothetical protein JSC085_000321 [Candidatus Tokpelaia sp. JSC085]